MFGHPARSGSLTLWLPQPTLPRAGTPKTWARQLATCCSSPSSALRWPSLGYKLFDKCTPGDLHKEILENKNVAAAIVAAAVILGVCIIIAAAMLG